MYCFLMEENVCMLQRFISRRGFGERKKRKSFYASVEKKELMRGRGWVFKMRVNLNHLLRIVGFEICTNESGELPENICPLVFGEKKMFGNPSM